MNTSNTCPQCGIVLPANAPESLCPACLMSGALPSESDPGATMIVEKPKVRALSSVGEVFGNYRIEHELGRGGMGAVYAAEHLESGRRVALKVLSHQLDSPEARARFLREGRLAASINHPNSVYVFGTEEIEGTPAIAMELIAGGTLQDRIQRTGALPIGEAVDAVLQIIAGLEAAHAVGILHRDIKPANCFTDIDGSVKVGDFGLSISTQGRGDSLHTIDGTFLGTPAFCSPEQLRGEELNVRSDMYSVGVTLFYLLTGRTPFEGKNMVQLLANALEKAPPSPTQFRAEVPPDLARVVLRCLSKQATERFGSYEELRLALMPFSSTAPAPAALGMRFVAVIVDMVVLAIASWLLMAAWHMLQHGNLSMMGDWQGDAMRGVSIVIFVFKLGYWGVLEGVWGASAGKALLGLRVARVNRGTPGIPRAMARQFILGWLALVNAVFFDDYFNKYDPMSRTTQMWSFVYLGIGVAYLLAMFVTARRANGFAAVHDLLTDTRVIQKAAQQQRTIFAQADTPIITTGEMPKLGPYHVLAALSSDGGGSLLLGYDTRLLRKVWIRKTPPGSAPVAVKLRNIARPGRLRWLQGERNVSEAWDAYEALEGKCLSDLLTERQPWASVRHWLHDLSIELAASSRGDALPEVLAPDRVWITKDGRAKLLDFAAPSPLKEQSPAIGALSPTPAVFLNQIAISALEGRVASAEEAAARAPHAPLPLSAHALLRSFTTAPTGLSLAEGLKPLLQELPDVPWWKRALAVLIHALPALGLGAFFIMGAFVLQSWQKTNPEFTPFLSSMLEYRTLERGHNPRGASGKSIEEQKAALEIVIAGRYGYIVRDPKLWSSPIYKLVIQPEVRAKVERIVAAHPDVGADELKQAEATVKSLVRALDAADKYSDEKLSPFGGMMGAIAVIMIFAVLTMIAVLSLACALIFRRGPLFRILGIAVVTQTGEEASRLRMLGRGLIAWSPVLFSVLLVKFMPITDRTSAAPFATLGLLVGGLAIASLCMRERGL